MAFFMGTHFRAQTLAVIEMFGWKLGEMTPSTRKHLFEICDEARKRRLNEYDAAVMFLISVATLPQIDGASIVGNKALLEWAESIVDHTSTPTVRVMLAKAMAEHM